MYIVRDIFHLKFGHYRDAKALLDDVIKKGMLPQSAEVRALSDFTGDSYRLIMEKSYETLADFEKSLTEGMGKEDWQKWYADFKQHVDRSYREILKQVV